MGLIGMYTEDNTNFANTISLATAQPMTDTFFGFYNFPAPASQKVLFQVRCTIHGGATVPQILFGLRDNKDTAASMRRFAPTITTNGNRAVAQLIVPYSVSVNASQQFDVSLYLGVEVPVAGSAIKYGGPTTGTADDAYGSFLFAAYDA